MNNGTGVMHKLSQILLLFLVTGSLSLAGVQEDRDLGNAVREGDVARVRELLAAGASVSRPVNHYDETALMVAAASGNIEMMQLLISAGARINSKTRNGESVLGVAVRQHQPESARFLLRQGARLKSLRKTGLGNYLGMNVPGRNEVADALFLAVDRDDKELLSMLLEQGADIDSVKEPGDRTALMEAAYLGKSNFVLLLLEAGADANRQDEHGNTAFRQALYNRVLKQREKYPLILMALLEHGAKPLTTDAGDGFSNAIQDDNMPLLESLVGHGIDVNAPTKGGQYALGLSARKDNVRMARYLLEHGADPDARDTKEGRTAVFHALKNPELFRLLINHGASLNVVDNRGSILLWAAIGVADEEVILTILDSGCCRETVRENSGMLLTAVSRNMPEVVKWLLENGADVNIEGNRHSTPLQQAFDRRYRNVALVLIRHGADINHHRKNAAPFIFQAIKMNDLELIKALIEVGVNINYVFQGLTPLVAVVGPVGTDMNLDIIDFLLEHGARADVGDKEKNLGALHRVCLKGDLALLKRLRSVGAPINQVSIKSWIPLNGAARNGSIEMINYLLDEGARINDYQQVTSVGYWNKEAKRSIPSELTTRTYPLTIAAMSGNRDALALLLKRGADVNVITHSGINALMIVVDSGEHLKDVIRERRRIDFEKYQKEKSGAFNAEALSSFERETRVKEDHNAKSGGRDVAAIGASYSEKDKKFYERKRQSKMNLEKRQKIFRVSMEKILIDAGIDVNHQDIVFGLSPLMQAIRIDDPDTVKLLMDAGARLDQKDRAGRTPADYANETGDKAILKLIRHKNSG